MLTSSLAQSVAAENAAVTGLGILITDPDGTVIGLSDPTRLGSFHEASVDVVRTRMPASHNAEQAAALRGVRPGLTLPLLVAGDAVGTVGITGSPGADPAVRTPGPQAHRDPLARVGRAPVAVRPRAGGGRPHQRSRRRRPRRARLDGLP